MKRKLILILLQVLVCAALANAQWTSSRPDGHAPMGVMGDHTHGSGEFMLSYRFMTMGMKGSRDGTDAIDDADIVAAGGPYGYMVTPTEMPMQMHMFGGMFAPKANLTLMVMVPVISSSMDHMTRAGGKFTVESSGVGDVKLSGLLTVSRAGNSRIHLNIGVSLPTGSIDQKDVTPASGGQEAPLPYPMQIGSGTIDLLPGITFLGQSRDWSWGCQGKATIRLGENDNKYTFGNNYMATVWGARRFNGWWSGSVRLAGLKWLDVKGADPRLNPAMVPTADPGLRAGSSISAGVGINFEVPTGSLHGFRLAVEGLIPFYQSLDGPQLETDYQVVVGTQYAW